MATGLVGGGEVVVVVGWIGMAGTCRWVGLDGAWRGKRECQYRFGNVMQWYGSGSFIRRRFRAFCAFVGAMRKRDMFEFLFQKCIRNISTS